eukprot:scaffold327205_cov54-Tisochrysis_lutea.AAC.2
MQELVARCKKQRGGICTGVCVYVGKRGEERIRRVTKIVKTGFAVLEPGSQRHSAQRNIREKNHSAPAAPCEWNLERGGGARTRTPLAWTARSTD